MSQNFSFSGSRFLCYLETRLESRDFFIRASSRLDGCIAMEEKKKIDDDIQKLAKTIEDLTGKVKRLYEAEEIRVLREKASESVRQRPLLSLGLAFAVGFALASMVCSSARRSSD